MGPFPSHLRCPQLSNAMCMYIYVHTGYAPTTHKRFHGFHFLQCFPAVLSNICEHWPMLANVGQCWPRLAMLAKIGRTYPCWPTLAKIGQSGLANIGQYWPTLERIQSWPILANLGQHWIGPPNLGQHWPMLANYWPTLANIANGSQFSRVSFVNDATVRHERFAKGSQGTVPETEFGLPT